VSFLYNLKECHRLLVIASFVWVVPERHLSVCFLQSVSVRSSVNSQQLSENYKVPHSSPLKFLARVEYPFQFWSLSTCASWSQKTRFTFNYRAPATIIIFFNVGYIPLDIILKSYHEIQYSFVVRLLNWHLASLGGAYLAQYLSQNINYPNSFYILLFF
jgi:hypothetical protein